MPYVYISTNYCLFSVFELYKNGKTTNILLQFFFILHSVRFVYISMYSSSSFISLPERIPLHKHFISLADEHWDCLQGFQCRYDHLYTCLPSHLYTDFLEYISRNRTAGNRVSAPSVLRQSHFSHQQSITFSAVPHPQLHLYYQILKDC